MDTEHSRQRLGTDEETHGEGEVFDPANRTNASNQRTTGPAAVRHRCRSRADCASASPPDRPPKVREGVAGKRDAIRALRHSGWQLTSNQDLSGEATASGSRGFARCSR